ncbi:hypothetical protein KSP39_PZI000070 [Platanthera zijinensis]|uniref:Uncharacterized protein n=1 Tax=Platanthera zijinensis TaxID=2320716 RepID=A0AAP0GFR2_9ASPA
MAWELLLWVVAFVVVISLVAVDAYQFRIIGRPTLAIGTISDIPGLCGGCLHGPGTTTFPDSTFAMSKPVSDTTSTFAQTSLPLPPFQPLPTAAAFPIQQPPSQFPSPKQPPLLPQPLNHSSNSSYLPPSAIPPKTAVAHHCQRLHSPRTSTIPVFLTPTAKRPLFSSILQPPAPKPQPFPSLASASLP